MEKVEGRTEMLKDDKEACKESPAPVQHVNILGVWLLK